MRVRRLEVRHVRGVVQRDLVLLPDGVDTGVVVVEGPNEAGKSTLGDALDVLLDLKATSRAEAVRSLQTAGSTEGPEVVAELVLGGHHLTYRKRFLVRPETHLQIHGPSPVVLAGDDAHDRVRALLDTHVDPVLLAALRLRQDLPATLPAVAESDRLVVALRASGEASPASPRERAVLDAARAEAERWFTPKGAKLAAAWREPEATVERLAAELADVDDRIASLADDVRVADTLERERPGREQRLRELEEAARRAVDEREQVERLAADLARRIELAATARLGLEAATGERARRAELVAERAGLLAELADVAARAEEHRVDHAKQAEAHQALEQARTDARALLDTRRRTLDAARTHLARRRDQVERDALHERLRRLADADARRLAAIGVIESIAVDDAVLDRLRTAEVERRVAETTLGAASAVVSLTAARAVEVHTDGHTVALAEGDTTEWQVSAPRSLHIDGLGRLDVVPGAGTEELASRAVEAATELATLLAGARVADMGAAEAAHRRRTAAERDLATAEADVAAALAGESADGLRARLAVLEARTTGVVPGDVEVGASAPIDLEAAEAAVREAEATIAPADAELARIDHELARVRAERERLQVELAGLEATLASVEQRDRAVDTQLGEARAERPDAELDAAVTEAVAAHAAAEAEVAAAEARLAAADPDTVAATADNAAAVVADLRARLADEATELTTRRARLELAGGSGLHERREHLAAELHHAEAELAALTARAAAARRLVDTLDRHRAELHRRYAAPLRTTVESYGRLVHGPGFSVELDESLTIERRILDGIGLDVDQLSVGAREQLALLTRLACATLVGPEGGVVWLDDALGNTDPDRLDALGPVLRAAGQRCQVVVLTCSPERYRLVGGAHRVRLHA